MALGGSADCSSCKLKRASTHISSMDNRDSKAQKRKIFQNCDNESDVEEGMRNLNHRGKHRRDTRKGKQQYEDDDGGPLVSAHFPQTISKKEANDRMEGRYADVKKQPRSAEDSSSVSDTETLTETSDTTPSESGKRRRYKIVSKYKSLDDLRLTSRPNTINAANSCTNKMLNLVNYLVKQLNNTNSATVVKRNTHIDGHNKANLQGNAAPKNFKSSVAKEGFATQHSHAQFGNTTYPQQPHAPNEMAQHFVTTARVTPTKQPVEVALSMPRAQPTLSTFQTSAPLYPRQIAPSQQTTYGNYLRRIQSTESVGHYQQTAPQGRVSSSSANENLLGVPYIRPASTGLSTVEENPISGEFHLAHSTNERQFVKNRRVVSQASHLLPRPNGTATASYLHSGPKLTSDNKVRATINFQIGEGMKLPIIANRVEENLHSSRKSGRDKESGSKSTQDGENEENFSDIQSDNKRKSNNADEIMSKHLYKDKRRKQPSARQIISDRYEESGDQKETSSARLRDRRHNREYDKYAKKYHTNTKRGKHHRTSDESDSDPTSIDSFMDRDQFRRRGRKSRQQKQYQSQMPSDSCESDDEIECKLSRTSCKQIKECCSRIVEICRLARDTVATQTDEGGRECDSELGMPPHSSNASCSKLEKVLQKRLCEGLANADQAAVQAIVELNRNKKKCKLYTCGIVGEDGASMMKNDMIILKFEEDGGERGKANYVCDFDCDCKVTESESEIINALIRKKRVYEKIKKACSLTDLKSNSWNRTCACETDVEQEFVENLLRKRCVQRPKENGPEACTCALDSKAKELGAELTRELFRNCIQKLCATKQPNSTGTTTSLETEQMLETQKKVHSEKRKASSSSKNYEDYMWDQESPKNVATQRDVARKGHQRARTTTSARAISKQTQNASADETVNNFKEKACASDCACRIDREEYNALKQKQKRTSYNSLEESVRENYGKMATKDRTEGTYALSKNNIFVSDDDRNMEAKSPKSSIKSACRPDCGCKLVVVTDSEESSADDNSISGKSIQKLLIDIKANQQARASCTLITYPKSSKTTIATQLDTSLTDTPQGTASRMRGNEQRASLCAELAMNDLLPQHSLRTLLTKLSSPNGKIFYTNNTQPTLPVTAMNTYELEQNKVLSLETESYGKIDPTMILSQAIQLAGSKPTAARCSEFESQEYLKKNLFKPSSSASPLVTSQVTNSEALRAETSRAIQKVKRSYIPLPEKRRGGWYTNESKLGTLAQSESAESRANARPVITKISDSNHYITRIWPEKVEQRQKEPQKEVGNCKPFTREEQNEKAAETSTRSRSNAKLTAKNCNQNARQRLDSGTEFMFQKYSSTSTNSRSVRHTSNNMKTQETPINIISIPDGPNRTQLTTNVSNESNECKLDLKPHKNYLQNINKQNLEASEKSFNNTTLRGECLEQAMHYPTSVWNEERKQFNLKRNAGNIFGPF